jgi:hypothetical protein
MLDLSIGLLNPFEYASKDRKFVDWNPDLIDHKKVRLMLGTLPQASDVFRLRFSSKFWGNAKTGIIFQLSFLQFVFEFRFYDNRHFDLLNNVWKE